MEVSPRPPVPGAVLLKGGGAEEGCAAPAAAAAPFDRIALGDMTSESAAHSNSNSNSDMGLASMSMSMSMSASASAGGVGRSPQAQQAPGAPFLVPRNPRDTVASGSPKRRIQSIKVAQQQQQQQQMQQMQGIGSGQRQRHSPHGSAPAPPPPPPPGPPPQSQPSRHAAAVVASSLPPPRRAPPLPPPPSDPDAEEQAMFESRLCDDEYGVAVRKIGSNGKSQLRYVRCIWVVGAANAGTLTGGGEQHHQAQQQRPLASPSTGSDVGSLLGGDLSLGGGTTNSGRGRGRNRTDRTGLPPPAGGGASSVVSSSGRSVSSLLGRIRRARSRSREPSSVRGGGRRRTTSLRERRSPGEGSLDAPIASPGLAQHADEAPGGEESALLGDDSGREEGGRGGGGGIPGEAHIGGGGGGGGEGIEGMMLPPPSPRQVRALSWGSKKKVVVPLGRFVEVRKGDTTDRTRRNANPSTRLLSLIADDPSSPSLDIEAPTRLDRDKFARAFARFLNVPLVLEERVPTSATSLGGGYRSRRGANMAATVGEERPGTKNYFRASKRAPPKIRISSASSVPDLNPNPRSMASSLPDPAQIPGRQASTRRDPVAAPESREPSLNGYLGGSAARATSSSGRPPRTGADQSLTSSNAGVVHSLAGSSNVLLSDAARRRIQDEGEQEDTALLMHLAQPRPDPGGSNADAAAPAEPAIKASSPSIKIAPHQQHERETPQNRDDEDEDHAEETSTIVSSLTQGVDHEIVDELHQALVELRAELEESRAEAARAVKVAEQAIQSAESGSSGNWNSTVTHKAAQAAAQAQKKAALALKGQRSAEEKLAAERKSVQFWRKQAEAAEQDSGLLTTRAVVAEIQKAETDAKLASEQRKNVAYFEALKKEYEDSDQNLKEALADATERNRLLEIELDRARNSEVTESKGEQIPFNQKEHVGSIQSMALSPRNEGVEVALVDTNTLDDKVISLQAEAKERRQQLETLRLTAMGEISGLPVAKEWAGQAASMLAATQSEARVLREKLAIESAMRKKLLHQVQDMKGDIRVYCRPVATDSENSTDITSIPSSTYIVLHRDRFLSSHSADDPTAVGPIGFEFDRVFSPHSSEKEVYTEVEDLVLGALDGYNICLMAYGDSNTNKSCSMIGDFDVSLADAPRVAIKNQGIHLMAAEQLFAVAEHRSDRYQDCFQISIVEVHDEKLRDLMAGTQFGDPRGQPQAVPVGSTGSNACRHNKLEIRTNYDGDTVVQGAIVVDVKSFGDVCRVWEECLIGRAARLAQQGEDEIRYSSQSHIIATLSVVSTNAISGMGTTGKIQFVDLAASDLEVNDKDSLPENETSAPTESVLAGIEKDSNEWKYKNESLSTLLEVATARSEFSRMVPYRNSTLTHLLQDNFTSDTKFMLLSTVSTDAKNIHATASALRFAALMRKINIGTATRHTISLA